MYQALYRKWRPQTFDEVVGQKHITEILKNQVMTGRLSHAYIFIGTRGTGKTTCARILAKAVNCEHPVNGNPCGKCAACRGIADGSVLDVVELDAASNNGVDNVRALREEAVFSPAQVRKRVYIIDEVHMLSMPAFNALLKILEEPPEHLMFILATTELQKVPATILSRCQRHSFKRIETSEIADYLQYISANEHFNITADAANLIARLAEGGVRDALSLLDQCSAYESIDVDSVYAAMGLAGNRRIAILWDHVLKHDTGAALEDFKSLWMDGKDPVTLLSELNALMRDVLVLQVAPTKGLNLISGGHDLAVLRNFGGRMTREEILSAMDTLQRSLEGMRTTSSPKTTAELCLVSLCDNTLGESLSELRARVSRLERQMSGGGVIAKGEDNRFSDARDDLFIREETPELTEIPAPGPDPSAASKQEAFSAEPAEALKQEPGKVEPDGIALHGTETGTQSGQGAQTDDAPVSEDVTQLILRRAAGSIPRDLRVTVMNPDKFRIGISGSVLELFMEEGVLMERFKRADVIQRFSEAAGAAGLKVTEVKISKIGPRTIQRRDIKEIFDYPEVTVID